MYRFSHSKMILINLNFKVKEKKKQIHTVYKSDDGNCDQRCTTRPHSLLSIL